MVIVDIKLSQWMVINSAIWRTLRQSRLETTKRRGTSDIREVSLHLWSTHRTAQSSYIAPVPHVSSARPTVRRSVDDSRPTSRLDSGTGCRAGSRESISSPYSAPYSSIRIPSTIQELRYCWDRRAILRKSNFRCRVGYLPFAVISDNIAISH